MHVHEKAPCRPSRYPQIRKNVRLRSIPQLVVAASCCCRGRRRWRRLGLRACQDLQRLHRRHPRTGVETRQRLHRLLPFKTTVAATTLFAAAAVIEGQCRRCLSAPPPLPAAAAATTHGCSRCSELPSPPPFMVAVAAVNCCLRHQSWLQSHAVHCRMSPSSQKGRGKNCTSMVSEGICQEPHCALLCRRCAADEGAPAKVSK